MAIGHDIVLVPQTAGSLTSLGAFFIVVLAPAFPWLWPWLDRRGMNPSKPAKMGIGLVFAGLGFIPLMLVAQFGKIASLEVVEGEAIDMAVAAGKYGELFELMLWFGIGSGVVFLLLAPLGRRWMHGLK